MTVELQIVIAMVALYLFDATMALTHGEGVLLRQRSGWRIRWAHQGQYFARRMLLWPPLWALHVPVFRLRWNPLSIDLVSRCDAADWARRHQALRTLSLWCYAQGVLLAGVLPMALFQWRRESVTLLSLLLIYLVALGQAWYVWRRGEHWGLTRKAVRSISLDCLLCPPMGLNAVRKVSLQQPCEDNLLAAAAVLLSPEDFVQARLQALEVLKDALLDQPEGSVAGKRLEQAMEQLQGTAVRL